MPMISVIVPCWNVERYLQKCVESLLKQTFTDFELLLVDDGSPDNCGAMCDEFATKDARIKVIHKENGGLSSARNSALKEARGEYIAFVDSDDAVESDFLETLYNGIKTNHAKMSVCGYKLTDDAGNIFKVVMPEMAVIPIREFFVLSELALLGYVPTKLLSRSVICENSIMFDESLNYREDELFVLEYLRCLSDEDCIAIVESSPYLYNRGVVNSLTRKYNKNIFSIGLRINEEFIQTAEQFGSDEKKCKRIIIRDCINLLNKVLINIVLADAKNVTEKIKEIKKVLSVSWFRDVLQDPLAATKLGERWLRVLKKRNAYLIYGYLKFCNRKK